MSHDFAASHSASSQKTARRKVTFQTTIEDLEGRVLMSAAAARLRAAQAHVRVMRQPKVRVHLTRAQLLAARRAAQMPVINVTPNINVSTNVAGSTSSSTSTPSVSYVPATSSGGASTTGTKTAAALTTTGGQAAASNPSAGSSNTQTWPANVASSNPSSTTPGSSSSNASPGSAAAGTTTTAGSTTGNAGSASNAGSTTTGGTTSNSGSTTTGSTAGNAGSTTTGSTTSNAGSASNAGSTTTTTSPPTPPAPTFADGTLIVNDQSGVISEYSGGQGHLISTPVQQAMGIQPGQLTTVKAADFDRIPMGNDYFPDGMYLRNADTNEISRYAAGAFHVVSTPVVNKLGLNASNTVTLTSAQYNKVAKSSDYFPEGMLVQNAQTNEVDIYAAGQRHWISAQVAAKMNLAPSQYTVISADQFNAIPRGKDYFPDGTYLQNQTNGEVSLYSGGVNRVISSPVALVMGLNSSQWISVSASQYNSITKGDPYYPEGIFISNKATGEIDQFAGGQRHWVSAEAYAALKLPGGQIAALGADQFNAIPVGSNFVPPTTTPKSNA
ncbi:hypothetical protein OJF2_01340 [Aquisphaera giovannonii]|uniref:Uncharacterized protein n=1 Tax=Aquisphaera giovannonii TaxID=406548 RepID=A0A5B9VUA6_9BACT|nr:hypothetical protein [Aquisphaera giovannonii]QEH31669.1 hypothetical protein OJF2_01340 [Aquisphaera giovannonii]